MGRLIVLLIALASSSLAQTDDWQICGEFRKDFAWGVAVAAHQIEGNNTNNDWWHFETHSDGEDEATNQRFPKFVYNSGRATDHYQKFLDSDLDRARDLGANTFRMSIEWSRIEPQRNVFSEQETAYYRQYLQKLKSRGLRPMVTLWHFTLPVWVQKPGYTINAQGHKEEQMTQSLQGWQNPVVANEFAEFAGYCAKHFGDLVDLWVTHNEPVANIMLGYMAGSFPPGYFLEWDAAKLALRTLAHAHNQAYDAIHANDKTDSDNDSKAALVGLVQHFRKFIANDPQDADDLAAQRCLDYFYHYHMLDAAYSGQLDTDWDGKPDQRLQDGARKLDYIGVNYYSTFMVGSKYPMNSVFSFTNAFPELGNCPWIPDNAEPTVPHNSLGWEIHPHGLYEALVAVHKRYALPVFVTENGMADADGTSYKRAQFIIAHLQMMLKAQQQGVDVRGYYHWTLTDNFEWREGFRAEARFGLYKVDVAGDHEPKSQHSLERTPTPAVEAFHAIIRANGVSSQLIEKYGSFPKITTTGR